MKVRPEVVWFDDGGSLIRELPADCLDDCSRPQQSAEDAVNYWYSILNFTVPREPAIQWLRDFGAWELRDMQTTSTEELSKRVLWLLCCSHREYPDIPLGLFH